MADLAISGPSQLTRPAAERPLTERYADHIHAGRYRGFGKVVKRSRNGKRGNNVLKSHLTLLGTVTERWIYAYAQKGGGYPCMRRCSQSSLDLNTRNVYSNLNYFQDPPSHGLRNHHRFLSVRNGIF
jgi:hypothetical protein